LTEIKSLIEIGRSIVLRRWRGVSFLDELLEEVPGIVGLLLAEYDASLGKVESFIASSLPNKIVDFVRKTYLYRDGGLRMLLATESLDEPLYQSDGSSISLQELLPGSDTSPELEFLKLRARELVELLPPREALCIRKRFLEDLTVGEIAAELGKSSAVVYHHVHNGLARLRILLKSKQQQSILRRIKRKRESPVIVLKVPEEEILDYLYLELKNSGSQSSWDWPADRNFALFLKEKDIADLIEQTLNSTTLLPFRLAAWSEGWNRKITKPRLRYLRMLMSKGLVISYWLGLGESGRTTYGIRRVRVYRLPEKIDLGYVRISS